MKRLKLALALVLCTACGGARSGNEGATGRAGGTQERSALTASCGLAAASHLTDQGIGQLTLGAAVADLRARCRVLSDTTVPDEEGTPEQELRVDLGADTVTADVDSGKVYRIAVEHPAFRTVDSLGVGSALGSFTRIQGVRGIEGEGGLFVGVPSHCGLSFRLHYEIGDNEHRQNWSQPDLERLVATVPVDLVLIVGCHPDS